MPFKQKISKQKSTSIGSININYYADFLAQSKSVLWTLCIVLNL